MNELSSYAHIFDAIPACTDKVPAGYAVDFLGNLIAKDFLVGVSKVPGARSLYRSFLAESDRASAPPKLGGGANGELWFEAVDWIVAAREARGRFVMATLGAFYGYQAVGSHRALALLNPMPCRLVCVEPIAEKMTWLRRHLRDNGIDPEQQWLIEAAVGATNQPVLFPVGAPTIGGHNCIATNERAAREGYVRTLTAEGRAEQALSGLLLRNSTGISKDLMPGRGFAAEIKFVSCVTLSDVLGPFDLVDYVEADLQQSEMEVFPAHMDLLKRKVRRIHIGTHGGDVHAMLHALFDERGWKIVFSYAPDSIHDSPRGAFTTGDGILTVRNPAL